MSKVIAGRVFRKWKSDLADKDRTWNQLSSNFDELFYTLHVSQVDIDIAEPLIKEAAAAHMPPLSQAKRTWSTINNKAGRTFEEFVEGWRDSINTKAEQAFFVYYSVVKVKAEERKFGNMSPREYAMQRDHVSNFGEIDFVKLLDDQERLLKKETSNG